MEGLFFNVNGGCVWLFFLRVFNLETVADSIAQLHRGDCSRVSEQPPQQPTLLQLDPMREY